ncbi:hypothetical protein PR048_021609 [Dryococelus australis]|uniref:Uncharacterized protein n=1 Tax=Dryococelus australis TaxID=614101 RepID=A0ABQ9GYN4_9NEOP|nr:hypothetical protein PR048_021609 [Dryococelus australis]
MTITKLKQKVEKLKKQYNIMMKKEQISARKDYKNLPHFLKGGRVKTSDKKGREKKQSSAKIERDITAVFEDDIMAGFFPGRTLLKVNLADNKYDV